MVLTTSASSITPALPANWVNTNEGTTASGDRTVNSTVLNITVCGSCTVGGVNFAIERKPVANKVSAPTQANLELGTRFMAPKLNGSDAKDGTMAEGKTVKILSLPTNATLRYDGAAVTANQAINSYDSTLLTVSPAFTGSGTVTFNYTFIDAASMAGNAATVTMPFGPTGFACDGLLKFTRQVTSGSATNTLLSYPLFNTGTGNFNTTSLTTYSNKAVNGSVYYKGYVYTMTMTPESNVLNELRPDGTTATPLYPLRSAPSAAPCLWMRMATAL